MAVTTEEAITAVVMMVAIPVEVMVAAVGPEVSPVVAPLAAGTLAAATPVEVTLAVVAGTGDIARLAGRW